MEAIIFIQNLETNLIIGIVATQFRNRTEFELQRSLPSLSAAKSETQSHSKHTFEQIKALTNDHFHKFLRIYRITARFSSTQELTVINF